MKTKFGFTLAEVLITLGIIGVVAALTLPSLVTNYQKQVTVNKLKKFYNTMAQASQLAVKDNDMTELDWGTQTGYEVTQNIFNQYYKPYLNIAKFCSNFSGCFPETRFYMNGDIAISNVDPNSVMFMLEDGSGVSCNYQYNPYINTKHFTCSIDINGNNPPNKYGRDIFELKIDATGKMEPYGMSFSREKLLSDGEYLCNKNSNEAGMGCTTLIIKDGWEIRKDYPW